MDGKMEKSTLKERLITAIFSRFPFLAERWAKGFDAVSYGDTPWTPFTKDIPDCRVAIVTTAGVHLKVQEPFDMEDENGDHTCREIPGDVRDEDLTITHKYYDHTDADEDINIVFPIGRLREMAARGEIGEVAPRHFGFMGHILGDKLKTLVEETAPVVAENLKGDGVEAVLLTPG